ncbi:4'-phosphopantetheinyl transferase family protein [Neptunicoccus sediminis]|uniref:4'-phosphopantetheinyl transferase family protein n=1 Tax=Neptunicoccus sediminis TaxID=1892596 RepID=UPI0008462054|nr:4'-phosphopantetheinyl transferase superfamily protein [Neptunicoccus sediminis]
MDINIDLWVWDLDTRQNIDLSVLSKEEQQRAGRFVQPLHQNRYGVGRATLRHILAQYTGSAAADLTFRYGANGKPALAGDVCFNLSHSEQSAALAVTRGCEIGLDLEHYRPVEPDLAERFFSPCERKELAALGPAGFADGFFRCWTRKEAVLKARGEGLSVELNSFDVTLTPDAPPRLLRYAPDPACVDSLTLHHIDFAPELVGAIAAFSHAQPVKLIRR